MDAETLNIIDKLSTTAILFLLLYKENSRTEKLLTILLDQAKENTNNMLKIVSMGYDRRVQDQEEKK